MFQISSISFSNNKTEKIRDITHEQIYDLSLEITNKNNRTQLLMKI